MPKVSIREIDNTGTELNEYLDYTVLIPAVQLKYKVGDTDVEVKGLFTDTSILDKSMVNPTGPTGTNYYEDNGYLMAYNLLQRGLSVYYYPAYVYELDTESKYSKKLIKENTQTEAEFYENLFKEFEDKGKYDLRFITIGGLPDSDYTTASINALKCAGNRGDATAILRIPEKALKGDGDKLLSTSDLDKWVKTTFGSTCATAIPRKGLSWSSSTEVYGSYGALYNPPFVSTLDLYEAGAFKETKEFTLGGDFNYLLCFAKYINYYPEWFATAGSIRGVSPLNSVIPLIDYGDADIDVFQVRSAAGKTDTETGEDLNKGHVATNILCNIRPYGNIIWGNRTMNPLSTPNNVVNGALQLTASSFLNIRQLCCSIKKTLYRAARAHTFEPNTDTLWFNFKGAITPLLERMKNNQGIKGYQVIKVHTNKKALLVAVIKIIPIEAVEDFDLTVELTDTIEVAE